jgi:hypothetical protein
MNVLWLWLVWLLAFPLIEGYALWRSNDKAEPLTHYVRAFMAYSWFFRLSVLLGVAWLFCHFAFGLG